MTVDDLANREPKQAELKDENRKLKNNDYMRKLRAKKREPNRMFANANQEQAVRKVENQLLARARIGAELLARQGWCHGGACTKPAAFGASDRGFARNGHPIDRRHQGGVSG